MKILGKGAYATVYLVTHFQKNYALKVYKKETIREHKLEENTVLEKELLLELNHPYILNLHYSFKTKRRLYLVLDYINGGDLFEEIQK